MSHAIAATPSTPHGPLRATAPLLTCLLAMWVAHQGALIPHDPALFLLPLLAIGESLPVLTAIALAALGWGYVARRLLIAREQRIGPVQLALGLAVVWWLDWLLAWGGMLNFASAWGICGVGTVLVVWQIAQPEHKQLWHRFEWPRVPWAVSLAALPVGIMLIAATCPPGSLWPTEAFGYDVMSYHLQLPSEWLANGRKTGLQHNSYSYLPSLVEVGYMQVGAMSGSMYAGIITTQLLHTCTAILAAWIVGHWLSQRFGSAIASITAAAMLALPWVIITGTLSYNEMAMLAFAAAAAAVTFSPAGGTLRGAAAVGLLCGAATLAKLPAGPGIALPLGLVILLRWNVPNDAKVSGRHAVSGAMVAAMVGLLVLLPWLIRNGLDTGNPVFPNAATSLGMGHWTDAEASRWAAGHGAYGGPGERAGKLIERWLLNPGYGAWPIGGSSEGDGNDITRFSATYGLPIFHLTAFLGLLLGVARPTHRKLAASMCLMLAIQVSFWILATHMQSRFMLASVLPAAVGVGLALVALGSQQRIALTAGSLLAVALFVLSMRTLVDSTHKVAVADSPTPVPLPLTAAAGRLPSYEDHTSMTDTGVWGSHVLNQLPQGSKVLMVADANQLIYIDTPIVYSTAFDRSVLANLMREHEGTPAKVTRHLVSMGITHVWVNYAELSRLQSTYGIDPELTKENIEAVTSTWNDIYSISNGTDDVLTLFALPQSDSKQPASGHTARQENPTLEKQNS